MSGLNCALGSMAINVRGLGPCLTPPGKPAPMASAYGGIYRCEACSAAYLAAGGKQYTPEQEAEFKRIQEDFEKRMEK